MNTYDHNLLKISMNQTTEDSKSNSECSRSKGWNLPWREKAIVASRLRKLNLSLRRVRVLEFDGHILMNPSLPCTIFEIINSEDKDKAPFSTSSTFLASSSITSVTPAATDSSGSSSNSNRDGTYGISMNPNWKPEEIIWPESLPQSYRRRLKVMLLNLYYW